MKKFCLVVVVAAADEVRVEFVVVAVDDDGFRSSGARNNGVPMSLENSSCLSCSISPVRV